MLLFATAIMTGEPFMYVNFNGLQMKPLLLNLIHQTILPFDEETMNISAGDKLGISFDDIPFTNYYLLVTNVSLTNFNKITNKDMFENGFLYRPAFNTFMKYYRCVEKDTSIVKVDFKIVECEGL